MLHAQKEKQPLVESLLCSCFVPYSIFHRCGVSFFAPEMVYHVIDWQPEGV
jgi:hypothetical protein